MSTTTLRTRRAIDAQQTAAPPAPPAFAALRSVAPEIAERLDEAATAKAAAEHELADLNARLRRLHPPSIFRENIPGQRSIDFELDIDEIDRRVAIADLEAERVEVSRRVMAARTNFDAVRRQAANALLRRSSVVWSERENTLQAARRAVEQALAGLMGNLMLYGEACTAERKAAWASTEIAREAVISDEARQALTFRAKTGEVAVAIADDGFAATVERPEIGLYGDETIDFARLRSLLELAFLEPKRAAEQLGGTTLGKTIETMG